MNNVNQLAQIINTAQIRSNSIQDKIDFFNTISTKENNLYSKINNLIPHLLKYNFTNKDDTIELLNKINEKLRNILLQEKDPQLFKDLSLKDTINVLNAIQTQYGEKLKEKSSNNDKPWYVKIIISKLNDNKKAMENLVNKNTPIPDKAHIHPNDLDQLSDSYMYKEQKKQIKQIIIQYVEKLQTIIETIEKEKEYNKEYEQLRQESLTLYTNAMQNSKDLPDLDVQQEKVKQEATSKLEQLNKKYESYKFAKKTEEQLLNNFS